jgi:hypothetical protein
MQPIIAVVASGFAISGDIDLRQRHIVAISVPTINSGGVAVQGNYDTTSGRFFRLMDVRGQQGSGDLIFPTVTGSRMIMWPDMPSPAFARVELIGAQTDNRTFVLLTTPRR